jgi:hypothetical protein
MIRTTQVLVVLGSGASLAFGTWHFFVPSRWKWYSYLRPEATELAIAIRAMNVLFSLSLVLSGAVTLLLLQRTARDRFPLAVVLAASCVLWTTRLALQIATPQGSFKPLLQHALSFAFLAVAACFAASFLLVASGR